MGTCCCADRSTDDSLATSLRLRRFNRFLLLFRATFLGLENILFWERRFRSFSLLDGEQDGIALAMIPD